MTNSIPIAVREQAAEWLLILQEASANDETRARWRQWRDAHVDHERAWQHIEKFGEKIQQLSSPLAHAALAPTNSIKRRQFVKGLSVLLFASGIARYAALERPWREWTADYRTSIGERRTVTLADGTRVALNSDTAVDVSYTDDFRLLRLIRGEILVTTAHDTGSTKPSRPFVVNTSQGSIRALGTYFSVQQFAGDSRSIVSVFEGAVAIRPTSTYAAETVVSAGEQAQFTGDDVAEKTLADETTIAWVDNMIVARDMPLVDFLRELNRHRLGRLTCDPQIAQLRVTGTYPLADPEKILAVLEDTLPLSVRRFTRYWVTLSLRES